MRIYYKLIPIVIAFICHNSSQKTKTIDEEKGKKIAYIQNNEYHFTIDTTRYKKYLKEVTNFTENINYEKVSITKNKVLGNSEKEYYVLMAYDKKHFLKTARWLIRDKDSLYLFKNTEKNVENEIFYRTYFSVYGSDTNCYPNVVCIEGKHQWTGDTTGKPYCDPDSPCKSTSTFIPYE